MAIGRLVRGEVTGDPEPNSIAGTCLIAFSRRHGKMLLLQVSAVWFRRYLSGRSGRSAGCPKHGTQNRKSNISGGMRLRGAVGLSADDSGSRGGSSIDLLGLLP